MTVTQRVFVYGTLMKGNTTRGLDQFPGSKFVGSAVTSSSTYSMYDLGAFPAACLTGDNAIKGEVWEVDENTFHVLDRIEGYPTLYNRKIIDTSHGRAWMYYMPNIDQDRYATKINAHREVAWQS